MEKLHLIATTVFGVESVVARELKWLGYDDQFVENGKVTFSGDVEAIARTNIWLRCAERVLLKMGEFRATTFEELFEKTKALEWEKWIPKDANFPVEGKSINSKLFSVPDCQAIVKKAIVERLKLKYKCNWFSETGPRYRIEVALLKDMVTLTIDTSGAGLHKRGYRKLVGVAPIKETMASSILALDHLTGFVPEFVVADVHPDGSIVDVHDVRTDVVEEVTVVGDHQHGAGIVHQEILQPGDRVEIQTVGRLVEKDDVRIAEQGLSQ